MSHDTIEENTIEEDNIKEDNISFDDVEFIINELVIVEDDISQNNEINNYYSSSICKSWIKLLPIKKTILFEDYNRKNYFSLVSRVILDDEINLKGKKIGNKKRNTLIQFIPTIDDANFNEKNEWIYIFLINDRIVKIGGTRTGLKGRVSSYLCGHHIQERGKSGDCSKTNGFIYNTFEFYLRLGCKIEMLGYKLPKTEFTIDIFENSVKILAQTFHAYETTFLEDYKKMYDDYPLLNDNCDPDYK
jgi:hypothetical protein